MSAVLTAADVSVYAGRTRVLAGVSLDVAAGRVVALLGPNGSGKTTLLRGLLGLTRADGQIQWLGRDLSAWPGRELAKAVAYLPQAPLVEPGDRVIDVLRLGRTPYAGLFGLDTAADDCAVHAVAADLGLTELLARPLDTLSGGQRQRVFLGRALAQEPKALLLDEPATYLDVRHQVELYALLRRLADERGLAILMAGHDVNLTLAHADTVVLLKAGGVLANGPAADVLTAANLSVTFDVPVREVRDGPRPLFAFGPA